jgi:hypothetical protein
MCAVAQTNSRWRVMVRRLVPVLLLMLTALLSDRKAAAEQLKTEIVFNQLG